MSLNIKEFVFVVVLGTIPSRRKDENEDEKKKIKNAIASHRTY